MKKTNNTLQKDVKTMEEMVASLRLQLLESEQKHQELTFRSKKMINFK